MSNKPIIIDCVDVSGCDYFNFIDEHYCDECSSEFGCAVCDERTNCYYKQLKRKEQSEERLVKQMQTICDFINNRPEIFKGIYGDVAKIITEYAERKVQECEKLKTDNATLFDKAMETRKENTNMQVQLDQLKAEIKSKTEYIQEQRDIINQYSKEIEMYKKCQGKRASKREGQLKQTLTEIKEIAEYHNANAYCASKVDMRKILQKIRECEGNDEI